ncbi:hypothetical protein BJX62DRAFT_234821 [Aspergillus germanicus]
MSSGIRHTETPAVETPQADNLPLRDHYAAWVPPSPSPSHSSGIGKLREQITRVRQLVVSREQKTAATLGKTRYEAQLAAARSELEITTRREQLEVIEADRRTWREKYWELDGKVKEGKVAVALAHDGEVGTHDEGDESKEYWRVEYKKERDERLVCQVNCSTLQQQVAELKLQIARTLGASQPEAVAAAEGIWRPKLEAKEREVDRSRKEVEDAMRELQREREMQEKAKNDWVWRKVQLEDELDKKDAAIADLEERSRRLEEELAAVRAALGKDKIALIDEYRQQGDEARIQAQNLEFEVRENRLAVKLLEMRLLEEEDANHLWKSKYVVGH